MKHLTDQDCQELAKRRDSAPDVPFNRPMTRAEVWEHTKHVWHGFYDHDALVQKAKTVWLGNYVYAVCVKGWDKPPDWKEGDPVIAEAVPKVGAPDGLVGGNGKNAEIVYGCLRVVRDRMAAARRAAA